MISPEEIIQKLGIRGLCDASEEYFASVHDWTFLQSKPFSSLRDAPDLLTNLGILLSGLRLCQTMRVLDFGAGSCWLTRYLAQMGCDPIDLDPSTTALKIGKQTSANFLYLAGHYSSLSFWILTAGALNLRINRLTESSVSTPSTMFQIRGKYWPSSTAF